jgi:hypothetical protein
MRVEHWDMEVKDEQGNRVPAINQWYEVKDVGKFRVGSFDVKMCKG